MEFDPLEAGLEGVRPGEVGEIRGVEVGRGPVADVLVRDVAVRDLGIIHPEAGLDQVGRDFGIGGVRLAEIPQGLGRPELLVVVVGEEEPAPGADQQVVADGVVGRGAGAPVRIIVADLGVGRVGVAGPVVGRERAAVLPKVVDEAARDAEVGERLGGQLGRVVNLGVLAVELGLRPVGDEGHRPGPAALDGHERPEEPQPVLEDVAAQAGTGLPDVLLLPAVQVVIVDVLGDVVVQGVDAQDVGPLPGQGAAAVVAEDVAVESVAAGAGDDVDHPAHRAAELSLVAAGLDLDLVEEVEVDLLRHRPVLEMGRIDSVDKENVLRGRGPVDGYPAGLGGSPGPVDAAGERLVGHPGQDRHERGEVAVLGQDGEHGLGHGQALAVALHVDERSLARDHDLLADPAELHGRVQGDGLLQAQDDVLPDQGLETC